MKKLLLLITALFLLASAQGQILRYGFYTAPVPEEDGPFPVVESITETATSTTDRTAHAISIPATLEVGDLLVAFFACDGNPDLSIDEANSTADWTIESSYVSGTGIRGAVIWRVADDDVDTLTLTTSVAQISMSHVYRITNYETSDPISVTYATGLSAADCNPPANTGDYGADDYLWIVAYAGDGYGSFATAAPDDFGNLTVTAVSTGGACSINSARREYNVNGAYDPAVFTRNDAEEWVAFTVIINPIQ